MRFCQHHWDALREAINTRGLMPLVARNGYEAAERAVEEVAGEANDSSYDPLMACHWMILGRAMDSLGLYLLGGDDLCPVCEVVRVHGEHPCEHGCTGADVEERWIEGPADAALAHVRQTPVLLAMLSQEKP